MTEADDTAPEPDPACTQANQRSLAFGTFFVTNYDELLRVAMYVGAEEKEAEDAVSDAMEDLLRRWEMVERPYPYVRRAMLSHFYQERTRGLGRLRRRQLERGDLPRDGEDPALTVWEDKEWVDQLLAALTPAQRQVMEGVLADLTTAEIGDLLGKTPAAVRQNLCAARERLKALLLRER